MSKSERIPLEDMLKRHFGYATFRTGQKEIISDVLQGKDVLGILPTGSGKSICYQLPARLLEGTTIVVSPLISLMIDQVKELKATGFKDVVALNSFMDYERRKDVYKNLHHYKLIYVSPEILQQEELQFYLAKLTIRLFVIDEAHCISQWGHEFRPDYQRLHTVIEQLGSPTVLALSATATKDVQEDILTSLHKPNIQKHIYPMDRSNIVLSVQEVMDNEEKLEIIENMLANHKVPSLVYFSSKTAAEIVSHQLRERLPNHRIAFYHGGMEQMDRITIQQQFMNDQLDVVCCTSAFGMGINKENIRFVFHYHLPGQLESYIQEIGRAGRDGRRSVSVLLYLKQDEFLPKQLIQSELPSNHDIERVCQLFASDADPKALLTNNATQVQTTLEISETQWRFITANIEKYSGKLENGLHYDKGKWDEIIEQLKQIRNERMDIKQTKLQDMLTWIHTETCLREKLYTKFQENYTASSVCCSNCGINLQEFTPESTIREKEELNWEKKLKQLLAIGE
ncbi:RecQ family ATP-dependent DNA helicase [Ornithinibacillus contaminans]|uniref:RecQ family ATP-dependent DNA helicase n=1 Tax=Ornithinibacillus contaminans TaxID=694055 RepID=UPI00064D7E9D|nr:RecQ family ATP-dependent DNA helicase [Ornithinibacillus contaminans]